MQKKAPDPTVLRHELGELVRELRRLTDVFDSLAPMWRGNVYTNRRRCGHPNCRCAEGDLHVSTVLADRSGRKPRTLALSGDVVDRFRRMTRHYSRFQHARARVIKIAQRIVQIADTLCDLRLKATLKAEKVRRKRE
jgi:hypothetical protein